MPSWCARRPVREKYALCVLLATHRLNTNHTVRKKLGARKVSFAAAEQTRELTGMEIGGVTPLCLPAGLPVWIDCGRHGLRIRRARRR